MRNLINKLIDCLTNENPVAYCRLVETRGSTPQKPGAAMLVYPDGTQSGTLGGGCVEAEVKRRALAVLSSGKPEIAKFQLDSDYGWDDGLICGGRMQVLVDPLRYENSLDYFHRLHELTNGSGGGTEAIAFCQQSSGLEPPASFLLDNQEQLVTTLGAVAHDLPSVIRDNVQPITTRPRPRANNGIAFLPLTPRCRLLIVGGGHVGEAVAQLAADLDFDVWVVDDREQYVTAARFPRAEKRITGLIRETLIDIDVTPDTYCLIVTRGHNHDQEALFHLANRGARYVGMIGSRRKIRLIFENLIAEGMPAEALSNVYSPVGLDIGSQTVPEIAVSIAAELVAHRNRGGEVLGRAKSVGVDCGT